MDLQPTYDPTGTLSQVELHTQDISNLIDGLNGMNDSISGTANIAGYGTDTFEPVALTSGETYSSNTFSFVHNLGYIPAYLVYVPGQQLGPLGVPSGFPANYYTQVSAYYSTEDSNEIQYQWYVGVNDASLFITMILLNNGASTFTSLVQQFFFYLLSNPASVSSAS